MAENIGALHKPLDAQALAEIDRLFAPPKRKMPLDML